MIDEHQQDNAEHGILTAWIELRLSGRKLSRTHVDI
jgi:hypothetical protein